jgi:MoaA/NifB/PqqE/SkfB family radical SAM enzyme
MSVKSAFEQQSPGLSSQGDDGLKYDSEADWQLLNTCGYRCEYCFIAPAKLREKLKIYANPKRWRNAFDRTELTWLLHMTGGEPTLYYNFAQLCRILTNKHYISFNSNLNHRSVVDFAEQVDPSRVSFINAGLHPEERDFKRGFATFLEHAECLMRRNFPIFISVVCTPEVLSRVDKIIALTAPIGVAPVPKLLRGRYRGKTYPEQYSAEERAAFIVFTKRAREAYAHKLPFLRERPSIDVFRDDNYVSGTPLFLGRACRAGEKFVKIEPDGAVFRCEPKESNYLGNILDGSFQPRTGAPPCDSHYCFYFCLKYADAAKPGFSIASPHETKPLPTARPWNRLSAAPRRLFQSATNAQPESR